MPSVASGWPMSAVTLATRSRRHRRRRRRSRHPPVGGRSRRHRHAPRARGARPPGLAPGARTPALRQQPLGVVREPRRRAGLAPGVRVGDEEDRSPLVTRRPGDTPGRCRRRTRARRGRGAGRARRRSLGRIDPDRDGRADRRLEPRLEGGVDALERGAASASPRLIDADVLVRQFSGTARGAARKIAMSPTRTKTPAASVPQPTARQLTDGRSRTRRTPRSPARDGLDPLDVGARRAVPHQALQRVERLGDPSATSSTERSSSAFITQPVTPSDSAWRRTPTTGSRLGGGDPRRQPLFRHPSV